MSFIDNLGSIPQGPLSALDTKSLSLSPSDQRGGTGKINWYDPQLIANPEGTLFMRGDVGLAGTPTEQGVGAADQSNAPFSHYLGQVAMGGNRLGADVAAIIGGGSYLGGSGSTFGLGGDDAAAVGGGLDMGGGYDPGAEGMYSGTPTDPGYVGDMPPADYAMPADAASPGYDAAISGLSEPGATFTDASGDQLNPSQVGYGSNSPGGNAPSPTTNTNPGMGTWQSWAKDLGPASVMGALQMVNNYRSAKTAKQISDQNRADFLARQAQMDNPPPYAGMNIQPLSSTQMAADPLLATYGTRAERNYYKAASGGALDLAHRGHGSNVIPMRRPMGGLDHSSSFVGDHGAGQQDNVPAMLSSKEYVMDADTVSAIGDGNPDEGARRLDGFRERIRAHKRGAPVSSIPPKTKPLHQYLRKAA